MWSQNNPVNSQINMYILSRITMGLTHTAVQKGYLPHVKSGFAIYGSVIWAIVMWLFFYHRENLQGSLQSSMRYLYEVGCPHFRSHPALPPSASCLPTWTGA